MVRLKFRDLTVGLPLLFVFPQHSRAELIAHWPLDDSGEDVAEGHNGVESGGVTFEVPGATAATGTATRFENGVIDVPFAPELNPDNFTITLWARLMNGSGHRSPITSRYDGIVFGGGNLDGFIVYTNPTDTWEFWTGDGESAGDGWDVLGGPQVVPEEWQHIAVTFEMETNTKSFYIDGVLVGSTIDQGYAPVTTDARSLHLGGGGDMGTEFRWSGDLDDVGLWDEVLSEDEILTVMEDGVSARKAPVAKLTATPNSGPAPLRVSFDSAGSTTPEGVIAEYSWEFGDGEIATGPQVEHIYTRAGIYRARLRVRNSLGARGSATTQIEVEFPAEPVPPWESTEIGTPTLHGGARREGDCLSLYAGGMGFGISNPPNPNSDELHFVHQMKTGDTLLAARLQEAASFPLASRAGLMFRSSLDPDSPFVLMGAQATTRGIQPVFLSRATQGGTVQLRLNAALLTLPNAHFKLERVGAEFVGSFSPDGVNFTEVRRLMIAEAPETMLDGLASTSADRANAMTSAQVLFCDVAFGDSGPPPNPPQNLQASAGDGGVGLSWDAPAPGAEVTGYSIVRDGAPISSVPGSQRTFSDSGLVNETEYCYTVRAVGVGGPSADSNQACATPSTGGPANFRRGDADQNGVLQITDAVQILGFLFLGLETRVPDCPDIADADDSGQIQLTDAIRILNFLFLGTGDVAPPLDCGQDPTDTDELTCTSYDGC